MNRLGKLLLTLVLLDMEPGEALRLYATLAVSLVVHVGLAMGLVVLPYVSALEEPDPIAIEVVEVAPEPEPPPPEPEPEVEEPPPEPEPEPEPEVAPPEPPPEPVVERQPDPRPQPQEPPPPTEEPPPAEPPPAEEAIADFTGETLTNDSGEAWASATGSGEAMEGPVGQPGATVTGRRVRGQRGGAVGGRGEGEAAPRIVPVSDLSRPPGIPDVGRLRRLLEENYPRRARELGVEGTARVRIRVRSDGRVQPLAVLNEEHEGFGQACRRTLRAAGRFDPPLDRSGQPVDTITSFTCTFRIRF